MTTEPTPAATATGRIPVDTMTEPHEPALRAASTRRRWALLLLGPVVWIVHFVAVYLTAETACTAERTGGIRFFGADGLTAFVIVATVLAGGAGVAGTVAAHRRLRRPGATALDRVAVRLGLGSVLAVLAVGAPIVVLSPC
jgi:hypothetical protein